MAGVKSSNLLVETLVKVLLSLNLFLNRPNRFYQVVLIESDSSNPIVITLVKALRINRVQY